MLQCNVVSNITMNGRLNPWRNCRRAFLNIKLFFILRWRGLENRIQPSSGLAMISTGRGPRLFYSWEDESRNYNTQGMPASCRQLQPELSTNGESDPRLAWKRTSSTP